MQLSRNTSSGTSKSLLIKIALVIVIGIGVIVMLSKVDFPSPNKKIEKTILNEKLKIIK